MTMRDSEKVLQEFIDANGFRSDDIGFIAGHARVVLEGVAQLREDFRRAVMDPDYATDVALTMNGTGGAARAAMADIKAAMQEGADDEQ